MRKSQESVITLYLNKKNDDGTITQKTIETTKDNLEQIISDIKKSGDLENTILEMGVGSIKIKLDTTNSKISMYKNKEETSFLNFQPVKDEKKAMKIQIRDSESGTYKSVSLKFEEE